MNELYEKNVIITGASSGIGRACAILCNQYGANVHLIARNRKRLNEVTSSLKQGSFSTHECDISISDDIEPLLQSIVREFGKIDGFIHSAGIQKTLPLRLQDRKHLMEIFTVNTYAAFDFSRLITKKVYANSDGMSIIFISSVMSIAANAGLTSYCASKAALVGGARAMAIELASRNIRINCVSPGTVSETRMTKGLQESISTEEFDRIVRQHPLGLGDTGDVANLCVFLLSDNSRWITGQNIIMDGGYSIQ